MTKRKRYSSRAPDFIVKFNQDRGLWTLINRYGDETGYYISPGQCLDQIRMPPSQTKTTVYEIRLEHIVEGGG